ncbi:hypothetical protein D3C71_1459330 [compost metagenome]
MRVSLVFLVLDQLFYLGVFGLGIVQLVHITFLGQRQVQLTHRRYRLTEGLFHDQRGIKFTCHQVVCPTLATQGDVNQLLLEVLSTQYWRTLVDGIEEDAGPVHTATELAASPLTPFLSLLGDKGFAATVKLDHLFNHDSNLNFGFLQGTVFSP